MKLAPITNLLLACITVLLALIYLKMPGKENLPALRGERELARQRNEDPGKLRARDLEVSGEVSVYKGNVEITNGVVPVQITR